MMFIIFLTETKQILSYGSGTPTESDNKLYLGSDVICNDLSVCDWKYIADQHLTQSDVGFVHSADYYEETPPQPTLQDQIDAILELI